MKTRIFALLLCSLFTFDTIHSQDQIPINDGIDILFIGNSLMGSKHGGLPAYIQAILEQNNENSFNSLFVCNWGSSLEAHWKNDYVESCTLRAQDEIKKGGWDIVVLQDFSNDLNSLPTEHYKYIRKFDSLIKAYNTDAKVVLMMRHAGQPTLSPEQYAKDYKNIAKNYMVIGEEIGAPVVPLANAWHEITTERGDILYSDDNGHQGSEGKAVNVYGFYAVFTLKSPVGKDFTHGDYNNELGNDLYYQQVMWKHVQEAIIRPSANEISFFKHASEKSILVKCEIDGWTVSSEEDWITQRTNGDTLFISVSENTTGGKRTGIIDILLGEMKQSVNIEQAESEAPTFNLQVAANHGTVITNPAKEIYYEGDQVTLTAEPDEGYIFESWSGDTTSTSNPLSFIFYKKMNITANFTQQNTTDVQVNNIETIIYPNPAKDKVFVETSEPAQILFTSNTGRILFKGQTDKGKLCIPLNNIIPGIYFISVIKNNKPTTYSLTVNHN